MYLTYRIDGRLAEGLSAEHMVSLDGVERRRARATRESACDLSTWRTTVPPFLLDPITAGRNPSGGQRSKQRGRKTKRTSRFE